MKKIASMCNKEWKKIFKCMNDRRKGIKSVEEEIVIEAEQSKKDKSIWCLRSGRECKVKEEWKKALRKFLKN